MPSPSRIIIDSLISPIAAIESSGYGFSSGVANRPAPRDRLTSTANDGRTSVNRFGPFNRAPAAPTPTTKPATSSVSSKRKTLADFTAEAKKKGKTGKAVSNYAYTMLKDYKMRTGTTALTGARISGTKKEGA
jgi:hypothetical protein